MTNIARPERATMTIGAAVACGLLGVAALGVYYSVPLPLPPPSAAAEQIVAFGARYHDRILLDAWLQAAGSALACVFYLALVLLARGFARLSGWVAMLGIGSVLAMSLLDAALVIGSVQAAAFGHVASALAYFDLTFVFIHVFPIVPAAATFAGLGGVLHRSTVLPRAFALSAFVLAGGFAALGFAGLFVPAVNGAVVILLSAQELWIVGACAVLSMRRTALIERMA